jgi:hypothetical protein
MLNPLQRVTLRAFLTALVELDSPLPIALQQEINKVGEMLANAQKDDALNRLIELAENDCLKESYRNARRDIQTQYKSQELNKYDKPSQQNQPTKPTEHIENIALPILQASDSSAEAKKHKSKIIPKKFLMPKIEFPTLNLFIYNLADGSSNTQDYWSKLGEQLKEKGFSSQINDKDSQRLYLWKTNSTTNAVDGSYSLANFDDTNCLRYRCSVDQLVELFDIKHTLTQIKDLALLPKIGNLAPGRLSENYYLGQTWMISGWTVPADDPILEANAHQVYKDLIPLGHQYQNLGEFLDATVYEMWRGEGRWDKIEKDSHVIVVFYRDQPTFEKADAYYNAWIYLFYCRYKILWAYEQARKQKLRVSELYNNDSLINSKIFQNLRAKKLPELKSELEKNIHNLYDYLQIINILKNQQYIVEVSERNYEKQCQENFPKIKWLEKFSNIVKGIYQVQLKQDYDTLNSEVAILENLTATIRGMVEIEQAELDKDQAERDRNFNKQQADRDQKQADRDRNFNTTIAILGIGLGTSQIASSIILAQQTPPKDIPFYQTQAFWYSIVTGAIASLVFWIILTKILPRLVVKFSRVKVAIFKKIRGGSQH